MNKLNATLANLILGFVLCATSSVSGGLITVIGATESSVDPGATAATGMKTADGLELGAPYPALPTTHVQGNIFGWLGNNETSTLGYAGWVHYDFGQVEVLDEMRFWNYSSSTLLTRSVRDMTVFVSNDSAAFNNTSPSSWTQIATLTNLALGPGAAGNANLPYGQLIDLPNTPAQYVRFQIDDTWGNGANVAFAEVQFVATPEPSSLALLSLALLTFTQRTRRSDRP